MAKGAHIAPGESGRLPAAVLRLDPTRPTGAALCSDFSGDVEGSDPQEYPAIVSQASLTRVFRQGRRESFDHQGAMTEPRIAPLRNEISLPSSRYRHGRCRGRTLAIAGAAQRSLPPRALETRNAAGILKKTNRQELRHGQLTGPSLVARSLVVNQPTVCRGHDRAATLVRLVNRAVNQVRVLELFDIRPHRLLRIELKL